jgi:hypothetical protein
MKRQASMILTALSFLVMLTATSVYAQSDMRLKVNIPFDFSVREKILPAGEYTVRYVAQGILRIQSVDRHASQTFNTLCTQASTRRDESSLVFHRYGDQYFLSTIWTAGDDTGQVLRKPEAEEELIRARRLLAKSASERQTVSIVPHR